MRTRRYSSIEYIDFVYYINWLKVYLTIIYKIQKVNQQFKDESPLNQLKQEGFQFQTKEEEELYKCSNENCENYQHNKFEPLMKILEEGNKYFKCLKCNYELKSLKLFQQSSNDEFNQWKEGIEPIVKKLSIVKKFMLNLKPPLTVYDKFNNIFNKDENEQFSIQIEEDTSSKTSITNQNIELDEFQWENPDDNNNNNNNNNDDDNISGFNEHETINN